MKTPTEFMSGLSKTDKMVPVLTYCIYWGEEEWDGPKSLKDMLDLEGVPAEICDLIGDYPLNLIEVNKFEHPEYFQTDLRIVFEFLQRRSDFEQMRKYIKEHEEELRNLPEETFDLMTELSNVKELDELKKTSRNEEDECDMCKAFDEMKNIGIREGREEAMDIIKKIQEMCILGNSKEEIVEICKRFIGKNNVNM